MKRTSVSAVVGLIFLTSACAGGSSAPEPSRESSSASNPAVITKGEAYRPDIDPADFTKHVDNPYFPLKIGTRWVYEGTSEDGLERIVVEVTDKAKKVMGIETTVVRDTVTVDGEIVEDTYDWYAQDADGNVWYMGEDTYEYERGKRINSKGAWEGGVDGALPGIVMPATPKIGERYRQEYYKGEAEDTGEVIALDETVKTKYDSFEDLLVTEDLNPFEPEIVENKYYAKGVGLVFEKKVKGSDEQVELVEFTVSKRAAENAEG